MSRTSIVLGLLAVMFVLFAAARGSLTKYRAIFNGS